MARVTEYTAKDYSDALSNVGTWIAENAEKLIGDDINYVRQIDLNITIEPDCIVTVNCNREHFAFHGTTPIMLRKDNDEPQATVNG